ncbi:hypothetical protein D3P08_19105 [Paenibacillus nanensis]|uniref:DUF5704 domain-containing protein n=1 Tax=Paenibacillus nanensis TaxID=393251 RepID=A0A3A1UQH8_9BACL|nr:hypothetical protein [Paenibacillus nanensis]RIX50807.1 hypothetical protein D3P08_19105 [Paenibacillus nanensis]
MRRIGAVLLLFLLLIPMISVQQIEAVGEEITTAQQSVDMANQYMRDYLGYEGDYFGMQSSKGKYLNQTLAVRGNAAFSNFPVLVYGDAYAGAVEGTKYGNDTRVVDHKNELRAIGFSFLDDPYANPAFHIDDVTYVRRWIKEPWRLPTVRDKEIRKELLPDDSRDRHTYQYLKYEPDTFSTAYSVINQWVKARTMLPDRIEQMTGNRKFYNRAIENVPEVLKDNPEDYIYMIQPPTYHTWGVGIAFYYYGGNGPNNIYEPNNYLYYQYFRYKPFAMLENDLSAHFELLPSTANAGDPVEVAVALQSTFKDAKTTDFEWDIRAKNGEKLSVTYSGHADDPSGEIEIGGNNERLLRAKFTMPASDVSINFTMNKNHNSPIERTYDNNDLASSPTAVKSITPSPPYKSNQEVLDYNVLSKKLVYPLNGGSAITATLSKPSDADWNGNATGSLNVSNGQPNLFREFEVRNNPPVNEASATISRKPIIDMKILRTDFGDDPVHGRWLNWATPGTPKYRTGNIPASGSVSRPYVIERVVCHTSTNDQGQEERDCDTVYEYGTSTAAFPNHTDEVTIGARIYNGMANLPALTYENKIDNNSTSSLLKKLYWKNEPYDYRTVRWMAHDAYGSLSDWTAVTGQYERKFTHQADGEVGWKVEQSQAQAYEPSRTAAKNKQNVKSQYDIAVFATDKELQKYNYPIKSGYYFNPAGKYTFTVETVTFKQSSGRTQDHKDLVDKVIDSFRYESDLIYIDNNKNAVNVRGEKLSSRGNRPVMKTGVLTRNNPNGVNGWKLLHVKDDDYDRDVEEITSAQDSSGNLHPYWERVLEGYSASRTQDSSTDYKYKEYVKSGQPKMYKVTERTTVTITIGPEDGKKLYTHAHMPDGAYNIEVSVGDVNLSSMPYAYKTLPALKGIDFGNANRMTVTVKGSMYDDLNS